MKILVLIYITLLLKDKTASVCDVPDGRDPCIYNSHIKMPYIATRNPSVRYTSYTDDDKYCDLFALAHGQWYSTFYNMTNYCVDHRACGSSDPMYLNGTIPQPSDGIVNRTACVRTFEHCCEKTLRLRIKNCHYFMVYCFVDLNPACHSRFCLDTDTTFETALTSTKATTTTPSSSSARMKKLVEKPDEHCQEKDTAGFAALIVMVVYSVFISIVAVVLVLRMNGKWKVCCQHRARLGGKIYQQKEGFQAAFERRPTVNTPPDCHAKI